MSVAVQTVKLTDVAELNPRLAAALTAASPVSFVPMSSVSAQTARVEMDEERRYAEVSKGYTPFLDGDLLVAKITPCFENGKIAQATLTRSIGFGSTEFHVIRPRSEVLDARYLLHVLRQDRIRREGELKMTGSGGQRRVPEHFLAELEIPLPPLPEQRRVAEVLDRAEALRAKRRAALTRLDELVQALFLEMFGDPVTNPKGWSKSSVVEVCELIVDCVNRTAPILSEITPFKMIRTSNVKNGKVDLRDTKYVSAETFQSWNRRATPRRGDVLLTREAPVGEAGLLDSAESVFLGQRLMLYRANPRYITPEYLLFSFRGPFLQQQFAKYGSGSTVKHLPLPACRSFEVLVPPISLQHGFTSRVTTVERLKAEQRASLTELDALFASLQHRAFRGEL